MAKKTVLYIREDSEEFYMYFFRYSTKRLKLKTSGDISVEDPEKFYNNFFRYFTKRLKLIIADTF